MQTSEMIPKPSFLQTKSNHPDNGNDANMNRQSNFKKFDGSSHFKNNSRRFPQQNRNNRGRFNPPQSNGIIRCNFKGCKFSGPQEVVKFHSEIQHLELRNKYNVSFMLNSPEDIEKWRAERRAKYPTFENIEKKDVDTNDIASANVKAPRRDNSIGRNQQSSWRNNNNGHNKRKQNYPQNQHRNCENFNIKRNRLEQDFLANKDVEQVITNVRKDGDKNSLSKVTPVKNNSLNLLSYYESDEELDHLDSHSSENPLENKTQIQSPINEIKHENTEEIIAELVNELLDKVQANCSNLVTKIENIPNTKVQKQKKKKRPIMAPPLTFSKLNLFQKLMLQDIRKVKHDMLECLQLIVDNQFLQTI